MDKYLGVVYSVSSRELTELYMNFDKFDWNFNPTDQKTSYANVSSTSSENTENSES